MVRNSFVLYFFDRHALLTSSFYIIVWTHPAEPSCLCPARPRLPTGRFWKWWSRNMVISWYYRILQRMMTAAGMRKRWSIKREAINFSTTRYRSFHFLGHACKAKEAVVEIFGHVKNTCNAQHGIWMELNRGWYSEIGADILISLNPSMVYK